jgi:hypothetical protein
MVPAVNIYKEYVGLQGSSSGGDAHSTMYAHRRRRNGHGPIDAIPPIRRRFIVLPYPGGGEREQTNLLYKAATQSTDSQFFGFSNSGTHFILYVSYSHIPCRDDCRGADGNHFKLYGFFHTPMHIKGVYLLLSLF